MSALHGLAGARVPTHGTQLKLAALAEEKKSHGSNLLSPHCSSVILYIPPSKATHLVQYLSAVAMTESKGREYSTTPTATSTLHEGNGHDVVLPPSKEKVVDHSSTETEEQPPPAVDIEHVYVENDPRKWSRRRKVVICFIDVCRCSSS